MRKISDVKSYNAVWRILLGILVVLVVVIAAVATYLPGVQRLLNDPGAVFAGDDVLQDAARRLSRADSHLRTHPNDDSAHLDRASAYLALGNLEGARLEWENQHERGTSEWGDIGRSLEELELKTDEIRALLHEAETNASPSEHYPPIYTLLDDIADRFSGIPHYRALFLKGYLLLREGRKAEAEPIFADELNHYVPLQDYVMYNHARSLMVSGGEDEALEEFDNFLSKYPSSRLAPIAHLERINIQRDLDRLTDALDECRRALDRYPNSPFAPKTLRKFAEVYESEMDFDNGADIRIRILRDFPESSEASETIGMFFGGVYAVSLLDESDRLEVAYAAILPHTSDAFEILSELADSGNLDPEERAKACHGCARCEYYRGHYYECIDWADRARGIGPGTEWADRSGIRKGHAYSKLNKYTLFKEALWAVARGHGELASLAAEILAENAYEESDLDTVEAACRYIVDEYPSSDETPAAMTMLAYLGCRDRQYQSAKGYADRCVSAFPDDPASAEAGFWFAHALTGLGRSGEADAAYHELAERVPWNYWGIRARENLNIGYQGTPSVDPFDFNSEQVSVYTGALATAWELYDVGVLDLAESEFILALDNGIPGAMSGLALVHMERGDIHSAVVGLRDAAWVGDQAHLTPIRQDRILDELYPRPFIEEIRASSLQHNVPPEWLWGAMRQESCFNPRARSPVGASGLIQIMPQTGRFIADRRGLATFDPETLFNPSVNIDYGAWYFDYLRDETGGNRLTDILIAYNAGPGRLRSYRQQLPTRDDDVFINAIPNWESRNFTYWVYANIRMYEAVLDAEDFQLVAF